MLFKGNIFRSPVPVPRPNITLLLAFEPSEEELSEGLVPSEVCCRCSLRRRVLSLSMSSSMRASMTSEGEKGGCGCVCGEEERSEDVGEGGESESRSDEDEDAGSSAYGETYRVKLKLGDGGRRGGGQELSGE